MRMVDPDERKGRSLVITQGVVPAKILLFFSDLSSFGVMSVFASNIAAMTATVDASGGRHRHFRVGEFTVRPESNELVGPSGVLRLRPILMDLLVRLARDPGKPVSREALICDVWPRRMVNDEVLSRAVAELRTVLGDSTREPRYVETLPKIGYRLVAEIATLESVQDLASRHPEALQAPSAERAAVQSATPRIPAGTLTGVLALGVIGIGVWIWNANRGDVEISGTSAPAVSTIAQRLAAAATFTSDVGQEQFPRFSPDGKVIAFTLRTKTDDGASHQVALQGLAKRDRVIVDSGNAIAVGPVFHPDAKRLAYFRQSKGEGPCGIVLRDLAKGSEDVLVDCRKRPRLVFDWSPDGKHLVYSAAAAADMPAGLVLLALDSRESRRLTGGSPGEGHDTAPRYDPSGRRIAFMRGTDSHREVWTLDPSNEGSARRVGPSEGQIYGLAWLDTGRLLVSADWHGPRALNILDVETGRAELAGAIGARYPDVSTTGAIAFESATYRADLWESNIGTLGHDARLLWPSTRYTNQAEYSPDGKRVVFASNRDGLEHLYVADTGGTPLRLPLTQGQRYIRPHWSKDGKRIYATRIEGGAGKLAYVGIVFDLTLGKETVLTTLGTAVADVREWDASGALLLAENERHSFRLSIVDAKGTKTRLPLPLVSQFDVRGNRMAYTLPQLNGVTVCEVPALKCERKAVAIGDENRFEWALGDDEVWFRGRDSRGAPRLFRHSFKGDAAQSFEFAPTASGTNVAVSPSGKTILLARESEPAIDLWISPPPSIKP